MSFQCVRWVLTSALLLVASVYSSCPAQACDSVTFAQFSRGWPPFEMMADGKPMGAALDIVRASMPKGVKVRVQMIPASRCALRVPSDTVYTRLESMEWVKNSALYLWSEPVLNLKTVLFSRKDKPLEYKDSSSLMGMTIGCIKSFSYPEVESLFRSGKASRYDVNSDVVLLRMLKAGRVDAALFDQYTARWLIRRSPELSLDDFHESLRSLGNTELRLAFNLHSGWEDRLPEVNELIRRNRARGVYDRIMDSY